MLRSREALVRVLLSIDENSAKITSRPLTCKINHVKLNMFIRIFIYHLVLLNVYSDGVDIPMYPAILTPNEQYSALPNTDHASIHYGDDKIDKGNYP